MVWIVLIGLLRTDVSASSIGCIKFYVDMSSNGYSGDVKVILYQENDPSKKEVFKLEEYGSQWTYFVDPGIYRISVKDGYEDQWNIVYDTERFSINGNEEHVCNITILKKGGNVNDNEDVGEGYKPVNENNTDQEIDDKKPEEDKGEQKEDKNNYSPVFIVFIVAGGIILLLAIWLVIKILKRENWEDI